MAASGPFTGNLFAVPGAGPPLRILFFTDLHAMRGREAPEGMEWAADLVNRTPCDLIIGGGDFVHGGFTSTAEKMKPRVELCREFLERLEKPVFPVIGNHDLVGAQPADGTEPASDPRRVFRELFGLDRTYYHFDHGGYRIFVLDSIEPLDPEERYRGHISPEQIDWLKSELEQTPVDKPLILATHIPFRTLFMQVRESPIAALPPRLVVQNANEILEIFAGHRLALILQGHLHVNEQLNWGDTHFIMGGAVSGAWWQGANLGTPPGFGVVQLGQEELVDWRYQSSALS